MMNNSGVAVKKLITNYQLPITHLWVVHDDLDLLLGKIKIVQGRGAAGHKGVESIIKELEINKFVRFRLGIGRPEHEFSEQEAEAFVLSPFRKEERSKAKRLVKNAVKAIKIAQDHGLARAMNQFN
jgi:PTH1 family peptidyl-tRNA hydrolase